MALAIATHAPSLLILASRSLPKITTVTEKIHAKTPNINIKSVQVDLASQTSIRHAANEIKSLKPELDVIINNAGINVPDKEFTEQGIEMHFGVNHIGLFLLTNLLIPLLLTSPPSLSQKKRIINLTSAGHRLSPIRFSDYNFEKRITDLPIEEQPPAGLPPAFTDPEKPYNPFVAYGQSKSANCLFSLSLTQKLKERGVVSFSVHPGCKQKNLPVFFLEMKKGERLIIRNSYLDRSLEKSG